MKDTLNVLAIGDIMGQPGRNILKSKLNGLRDVHRVDIAIVNGENAAGGRSITPEIANDLLQNGIDVITSGNHIWDNKDVYQIIDLQPRLLRPANYPEGTQGKGFCCIKYKGTNVYVINLMGRTFMNPIDCPFRKFDEIYEEIEKDADIIIVDFHAEATSEKRALGWYVDGRASLLFGTHTHVMTADEEILPSGTAYITDLGMTGAFDSVIGVKKEFAIDRFLFQTKSGFEIAAGNPKLNAIFCKINKNGRTESISRIIT